MSSGKPKIGIIGCGNISQAYLTNIQRHGVLDIVAVSDLIMERAHAKASEFKIPRALEPEQFMADAQIEYVLNLTVPQAHQAVAMAALDAGKHVYSEKPLAAARDKAKLLCDMAKQKGLRLGSAPDTFMGAGLQTCRKWLDEGKIGEPVGVEVVFNLRGYRDPNHFHWKRGAGVLLDMGPYYFTAIAALLGSMKRVTAFTRHWPAAEIRTKYPNWRDLIEVPSHVAAVVELASGVLGNLTFSTEIAGWYDVLFKIHGTEATMICPDPNTFHGEVAIVAFGEEKERLKVEGQFTGNERGIGLADMAFAQRAGRPHRASAELAYHAVDAMCAVTDSAEQGRPIELTSTIQRPEPFWQFES